MATVTVDTAPIERLKETWEGKGGLWGWLTTVDHKKIGKLYLATSVVFLLIGGVEAGIMRAQLAWSNLRILSPGVYDQLFSLHGMTMIFWYASPILSGFSNYIWPLLIGSRDMAYPRANALSYWLFLMSGVFLYTSPFLGQAPNAGWFAYVPFTLKPFNPGLNMDFYALGLLFLTVSATVGSIVFIGTIMKMRATGMTLTRLPIFMYGTMTASFANLFALPALTTALVFLYFERTFHMPFYAVGGGGRPLLWQHLFWMFAHPWVYIIVLPAMGIVSEVIPVFSRRPLVGYPIVAMSTVATGIIGFGVWLHHMFATGLPNLSLAFFSGASTLIVIPSGIAVFSWIATMWTGRPVFKTAMLFAAGFVALFVLGGVSGVVTAMVAYDWQVTDSYFVVAHLHYVLIGINVFGVMTGFYYWFPKMTGRLLNETLGKLNFWVMFIGVNVAFFPMHITGILGMERRIYTYPAGLGWSVPNLITTIGAYIFAAGFFLFLVNVWYSLRAGEVAGPNPWDAGTLEWSVPSPAPAYNFAVLPTVRSGYPLWEGRLLRRGRPPAAAPSPALARTPDAVGARAPDMAPDGSLVFRGPLLLDGKETFATSPLDAEPMSVLRMPEDSLLPLLLSLFMLAFFYGAVFKLWWLVAAGAGAILLTIVAWTWPRSMEGGSVA